MTAKLLESDRLIFKPVSTEHLSQRYVDWMNDLEVYQYMDTGGNMTLENLKLFLEDIEKKDILFWAVHLKSNNLHIGNIKIDPVNTKHNIAEYGIMLGEKSEWGKGYAKEATLKIIDFCFKVIGIRKITLGVIVDNISALKLYENLGFEVEGLYKKHAIYRDKYYDVVRMAVFNPKYISDAS